MITTRSTNAPLEVKELRKVFRARNGLLGPAKEFVAVDSVSFRVEAGRNFGIIGESGSGKTTIARMLVGLERPTSGEVLIQGQPYSHHGSSSARLAHARKIQMVFQDPYSSLDPRQAVLPGMIELLGLYGTRGSAAADEALEILSHVGIDGRLARTTPDRLSGGQRQRVAIARALAAKPQIVLLDEAVAALDVSIQAQILNMLADIREKTGVLFILISHDLAVVRQLTDDCIVMRHGRIVEAGTTEAVLSDPRHDYTRALRAAVPHPDFSSKAEKTSL